MNIDQQIQVLVDQAPQYGATSEEVRAIAPALQAIASQLKHLEYYVLQTLEGNWVMTVLESRTQPNVSKNLIYVFPTLKDASSSMTNLNDPQIVALPIPIVHILFQMLAMKPLDSIIFFEASGNLRDGAEVSRTELMAVIQLLLQQSSPNPPIPPDIA
jgi:hypothetical protein